MTDQTTQPKPMRLAPPPPRGFDALTASKRDLLRHGLPQRPDATTQRGAAALWEERAVRYRDFEHLPVRLTTPVGPTQPAGFGLFPGEACGFEFTSLGNPITIFTGTWTVPDLAFVPGGFGPVQFRTFFGLGFLDVHVEMTVTSTQQVTAVVRIHTGQQLALPVRPGDVLSATLCLQTDAAGTASHFLANETTGQTVNFTVDTGFPPAVTANAGISRGFLNTPNNPLARFGVVYFDELALFTLQGSRFLTDGVATTMVDRNGATLARPQQLTPNTFKIIRS